LKFTTTQEEMKAALDTVKRVAAAKSTLPALSMVLIQADDTLMFTTTDLERFVQRTVKAKIAEKGQALVPVTTLSEYVASLPSDAITLSTKKNDLHIKCGRFESTVKGINPEEYPTIPNVPAEMEMDGDELRAALNKTAYACATDDSRPVLTALCFDGPTLVSADGFRLAKTTMPIESSLKALVPARSIKELVRLLSGTVKIGATANHLLFEFSDTRLGTRLIEGQFPPYERIIPTASGTEITVSVASLLSALKSATVFAREASMQVKLTAENNALTINAKSAEEGDATAAVDAEITGNISFALNVRYLSEMLNALGSERATFFVTSPSSPVLVKPVGDESSLHLCMPMNNNR
jgi:DNA polymerase-3 subunit beta